MNEPSDLRVGVKTGAATTALVYHAAAGTPRASFVLAHGAGAGQHSAFITGYARAFAGLGFDVVTFDFLYIEQGRRLPDRAPVLESCYRAVVEAVRRDLPSAGRALFIGGKSMGGRIATHIAAADGSLPVAGLVLFGYPLHPPGKPERRRDAHLSRIAKPMLVVQGSRDAFGTPAEIAPVLAAVGPHATLHVVEGGDHSFAVSRRGPTARTDVAAAVQRVAAEWMVSVVEGARPPHD